MLTKRSTTIPPWTLKNDEADRYTETKCDHKFESRNKICKLAYANCRVRNERIDCHRFSGIASQRVEWADPDIEQVKREAPSPSFLQEKQKYLK